MNTKYIAELFVLALPYVMAGVFLAGAFFRYMIWYTTKRHAWFAREFEVRVAKFIESERPGDVKNVSFFVLAKRLLERTYFETFANRDRQRVVRNEKRMSMSDRVFLIKPGCAWMVKDILNQLKFLKWTKDTPKLLQITRATFASNPCFNRIFGVMPIAGTNDMVSILPGLFVIAGILGTFLGIAGGLEELGNMNLQDLDATKNVMDRFLQEIAFAMKTSITGIVFSLAMHIINTIWSPERTFVAMVDSFENSLDLLWYRADNNDYPKNSDDFNEHRDPAEALAEDAVSAEVRRFTGRQVPPKGDDVKAS